MILLNKIRTFGKSWFRSLRRKFFGRKHDYIHYVINPSGNWRRLQHEKAPVYFKKNGSFYVKPSELINSKKTWQHMIEMGKIFHPTSFTAQSRLEDNWILDGLKDYEKAYIEKSLVLVNNNADHISDVNINRLLNDYNINSILQEITIREINQLNLAWKFKK